MIYSYNFQQLNLQYVGAHGTDFAATGEYVNVYISEGTMPVTETVFILPIVIMIAMMAIVLSFIHKYSS